MSYSAQHTGKKGVSSSKWISGVNIKGLLFLLPAWILLIFFFFTPSAMTFYLSFTDKTLTGASTHGQFIGFDNFVTMFQDDTFRTSVKNTIVFLVFSSLIGQQVLGFIIALLMNERPQFLRSLIGAIVVAGWVIPEIICAFVWFAFFNDQGTANIVLNYFHLESVTWLYTFPMTCVVIANIWHGTAFSMLMYQAALGDVSKDMLEAASMDGATAWQRIWKIILPHIKSSVVTNMVLNTLSTLGVFTLIYAMTGGGPGSASETMPLYMYHQAFQNYQLGYGTAISMVLLLIGIVASFVYIRVLKVKL